MSDRSNEYGYIQDGPTQSNTSNSGVFLVNDVVDLINQGKYARQGFNVQYLVIAGGGGGSGTGAGGGGGGAGGYRNSYASENSGGGGSTETVLVMPYSTAVTVTVGAGGASTSNSGARGNDSVLSSITSTSGGSGFRSGLTTGLEDGGSRS